MNQSIVKGHIFYSTGPNAWKSMENGYLVCKDGFSQGVFSEIPQEYASYPLRDYGNQLIIPGLVDLHLHAPQFSFRGLGMDLELLDWLNTHTFPEEARYQDPAYAQAAYGCFVDALKRSFTTRAAIFATAHTQSTLLLMELLEETGLDTCVGRVNMDRLGPDNLRESGVEQSMAETRRWLESCRHLTRTKPILTPRFVPACSGPLLEELGKLAHEAGLPVQSHLSENSEEIRLVRSLHPEASCYGGVYDRFGLLDAPGGCIMAHCVHSSEKELALLKERGVYIAHSPESNLNLRSGVAPVSRYLDLGLRVGLASDVAGGSTLDMMRTMGYAIGAGKLRWRLLDQSVQPLNFNQAFYMATLGGGSFFGKVGSFEPGYALDALVLDDSIFPTVLDLSIHDRVERLAYVADDRCISAKFVAGRKIK